VRQERKPIQPLPFFLSIVFLAVLFTIYLSLRPIPADPEAYAYLANLRALTETGSFFGIDEPLPILLLFFWKSVFGLNYLTAFHSFSALGFSFCLHLGLLLFRRHEWKMNHYFLVYLSAFLPLTHEFPVTYFNEMICALFLLSIAHTFRMESILDLLLFPALCLAAFFADLRTFLFGFSLFVLVQGWFSMQKVKSRTTVFYKRKNIPFLVMMFYFGALGLFLIIASIIDFFDPDSFSSLVRHWFRIILQTGPAILAIVIGNLLLDTEKELNTRTFTGILVLLIFGVILFNYSKYDSQKNLELEEFRSDMVRSQVKLSAGIQILGSPIQGNYLYFQTKIPIQFVRSANTPGDLFLFLNDIWQADLNEMNKKYSSEKKRDKKPDIIPLGERSVLISNQVFENLSKEVDTNILKRKAMDAFALTWEETLYLKYLRWQQSLFGYTTYQLKPR
jgi:hypothetical protein